MLVPSLDMKCRGWAGGLLLNGRSSLKLPLGRDYECPTFHGSPVVNRSAVMLVFPDVALCLNSPVQSAQ
jgi:hypothetical protein